MSGRPPRPGPSAENTWRRSLSMESRGGGGGISAAAGAREQTGRHVRSRGALTPTPPQGSRTKTDVSEPAGTGSEVRGQGRRRPRECRGPPGSALALWSTHETPPVWPEAGALVGCGRWACGAQPCREAAFNMATASPHGAGEAPTGLRLPARAQALCVGAPGFCGLRPAQTSRPAPMPSSEAPAAQPFPTPSRAEAGSTPGGP